VQVNENKEKEIPSLRAGAPFTTTLIHSLRLIKLDGALGADRVEVHPCDENNDLVKFNGLSDELKYLFKVRHAK
jgi:hypothetical protein